MPGPRKEESEAQEEHRGGVSPRRSSYGRRKDDYDTRTNLSVKAVTGIVFMINLLYFVSETITFGRADCL